LQLASEPTRGQARRGRRERRVREARKRLRTPPRAAIWVAQAACGRYCSHAAGIVGLATWMKISARGVRGAWRGCIPAWRGRRSPLRRLQGAQEATMFSQLEEPPFERGITWSKVRARAAVLAGPAVAGEHGASRDLAPVRVARHVDVADQADHDRARERRALGVQLPHASLEQLGLLLEQQHDGAAHRAHVDRLIRGVQNEHPTAHRRSGRRCPRSVPLVLGRRHGPHRLWWGSALHGQPGSLAGLRRCVAAIAALERDRAQAGLRCGRAAAG